MRTVSEEFYQLFALLTSEQREALIRYPHEVEKLAQGLVERQRFKYTFMGHLLVGDRSTLIQRLVAEGNYAKVNPNINDKQFPVRWGEAQWIDFVTIEFVKEDINQFGVTQRVVEERFQREQIHLPTMEQALFALTLNPDLGYLTGLVVYLRDSDKVLVVRPMDGRRYLGLQQAKIARSLDSYPRVLGVK